MTTGWYSTSSEQQAFTNTAQHRDAQMMISNQCCEQDIGLKGKQGNKEARPNPTTDTRHPTGSLRPQHTPPREKLLEIATNSFEGDRTHIVDECCDPIRAVQRRGCEQSLFPKPLVRRMGTRRSSACPKARHSYNIFRRLKVKMEASLLIPATTPIYPIYEDFTCQADSGQQLSRRIRQSPCRACPPTNRQPRGQSHRACQLQQSSVR